MGVSGLTKIFSLIFECFAHLPNEQILNLRYNKQNNLIDIQLSI